MVKRTEFSARNFYGTLRVIDAPYGAGRIRQSVTESFCTGRS